MKMNLGALLSARGMTQTDLADALGISPGTVSKYATGKQMPRPGRLQAIAEVLACQPSQLFAEGELSAFEAETMDLIAQLDERDREDLVLFLRAKVHRARDRSAKVAT